LTAGHVEDHDGNLGARDLGHRLLHEGEAWPVEPVARGSRRRGAPGLADRLELALGVDAVAADLGQAAREVLEDLGEGVIG